MQSSIDGGEKMAYRIRIQSESDMHIAKRFGARGEGKLQKYIRRQSLLSEEEAILIAARENKIVAYA